MVQAEYHSFLSQHLTQAVQHHRYSFPLLSQSVGMSRQARKMFRFASQFSALLEVSDLLIYLPNQTLRYSEDTLLQFHVRFPAGRQGNLLLLPTRHNRLFLSIPHFPSIHCPEYQTDSSLVYHPFAFQIHCSNRYIRQNHRLTHTSYFLHHTARTGVSHPYPVRIQGSAGYPDFHLDL